MKIRIFLSSSSEHSSIAKALEANLASEGFEPTLWSREAHGAGQYNLEALLREANGTDFGIFVFAPDDQIAIRGELFNVVRDNVLFELGVFIGILGRSRCFIVQSTEQPMRLPSDLDGITTLKVDPERSDGNLRRSFGPIVTTITDLLVNTAKAQVSDFTTNDLKLLKSCKDTSMPSNQAAKTFGNIPTEWDDKLCMRFVKLLESGLIKSIGATEIVATRSGNLLAEAVPF